jgi:hypothetical protein
MSSNNRIFYACQGVAIANHGTPIGSYSTGNMVHGLQSIGVNTTFNLQQAFELGQIEIYENIEGTPDVEVTLEKVLDGYPLIYLMASTGVAGTSASGLVARSKSRCDLRLGIFDESSSNIGSSTPNSGKSEVEIYCSGLYISSVSYKVPVDGNATESVTLVGNNKTWLTSSNVAISQTMASEFDGTDSPLALGVAGAASGGIQRREDVILSSSILPASIKGVNGTGIGNGISGGHATVHIQNFSCSTDFSREDVLELGRKTPYYRPAGFPVQVKCDIEAITTSGDFVSAYENGDSSFYGTVASGDNTQQESISLYLRGGMRFDLGTKNRLASVSYGGGDATGGNVSCTYSYQNFNELYVYQVGHNMTQSPY